MPVDAEAVHAEVDALAADGLRVLAFARGEVPAGQDTLATTTSPRASSSWACRR